MRSRDPSQVPAYMVGDVVEHRMRGWKFPIVEIVECLPMDHYKAKYGESVLVFTRRELGKIVGNTRMRNATGQKV